MAKPNIFIIAFTLPLLCGCARGQGINLYSYWQEKPTRQNFDLCHGFSCTFRTPVSIEDATWENILLNFSPPAQSAKEERAQIATAIAQIEQYIQTATGMNKDLAQAENFESDEDQMDCIDETINTSRYLAFLEQDSVLKFHRRAKPIHRGYFIDGRWPHNTATIEEISTGRIFTMDSYYYDSGNPPAIVTKNEWLDGWKPEE